MSKIYYFNSDGTIKNEDELTSMNLNKANGMLSRCTLKDGTEKVGYIEANPFDTKINLWTWKNIDEENHALIGDDDTKYDQITEAVNIDDIEKVETKLHSNPRWGGKITNKFE